MRRIAVAAVPLLVAGLVFAPGARAGREVPKQVHVRDRAGDAHYLVESHATYVPTADILSAWFENDAKTISVHIHVAAAPPGDLPIKYVVETNPPQALLRWYYGCVTFEATVEGSVVSGPENDYALIRDRCNTNGRSKATLEITSLDDGSGIVSITGPRLYSLTFSDCSTMRSPRVTSRIQHIASGSYLADWSARGKTFALKAFRGTPQPSLVREQGRLTRATVSNGGTQLDGSSFFPDMSGDGRFVVFESNAANVSRACEDQFDRDLFVRDRLGERTLRIDPLGGPNKAAACADVSSNGRFISFDFGRQPYGPNLAAWVQNLQTGRSRPVSVWRGRKADAICPTLSPTGRYVSFSSEASFLVRRDTNATWDVFIKDLRRRALKRVSISRKGRNANAPSCCGSISRDGRTVTFLSLAGNLVKGDTGSSVDVFAHNPGTRETVMISKDIDGGPSCCNGGAELSDNGRFVVWHSDASDLVRGDENRRYDVFVRDLKTDRTRRVSVSSKGNEAVGGESGYPAISGDGRFISFMSSADNLVPDDTNGQPDIFVHDRVKGTTRRVSMAMSGREPNLLSLFSDISSDGKMVTFDSAAGNLVLRDTNSSFDIFIRPRSTRDRAVTPSSGSAQTLSDIELRQLLSKSSMSRGVKAAHESFLKMTSSLAKGMPNADEPPLP
ncbi:MAG: hypothetical protein M3285_04225 [Actinomycetota bacterium]|nr:hypothetical protein [Actinomycetota bacterium]